MDKRVLEWLDNDGPMPKDLILKLHNGTPGVEDFITPISKRINQLTPLEMVKLKYLDRSAYYERSFGICGKAAKYYEPLYAPSAPPARP